MPPEWERDNWEAVIGLEIHAELNTKSKLFSVAPNRFGDEPNTNITEVCTGQPGALPVLNEEAVRKAVQFGCAINASIETFSKFDRKSYFYPDSPRNFQITQYEEPIVLGGTVTAEVEGVEHIFAVNRVHLEDDAGMLKHFSSFAGVDYNRAGVPLIEIVSEPCMHTPQQAVAYAMMVRAILQYIDACDCNMEEGHLRFDANISVRKKGETQLRNKTEIKNMNSFSFMQMALDAEIKRQIKEYIKHPQLPQNEVIASSTYRWDPNEKRAVLMRSKEQAEDYRYFPEPDLPPIILTQDYISEIREKLPELPLERERRYINELGLAADSAFILASDKQLADYFDQALAVCDNPRSLCNWLIVEFAGRFKESGKKLVTSGITPKNVGALIQMIDDDTITSRIAKAVADNMVSNPSLECTQIVQDNPAYQPIRNTEQIEAVIDKVLKEHFQAAADFKAGKDKALSFLVGQVMKHSKGKFPPHSVTEMLKKKIDDLP